LVLLVLSGARSLAGLPEVEDTKIFDDSAGGSFTVASQVQIDGKRVFLKSNRGSPRGTRYANFEADILAHRLFEQVGIRCPEARMVRLASSPRTEFGKRLDSWLGLDVLAMEFVNTRFTSGRVYHGGWPGDEKADTDRFIDLLLIDLLIGNADRRAANLFVGCRYTEKEGEESDGSFQPIPIDNNSGFGTMVVWRFPSSQMNFLETYDGVGSTEVMKDLGTIRNLVMDSEVHQVLLGQKRLRPRILVRASELRRRLHDGLVDGLVADLPREIIPRGVKVDPAEGEWLSKMSVPERRLLFGSLDRPIKGNELFEYRKDEIGRRFRWRRDHLEEALRAHFASDGR
ncbi:MAG: hypothetical protein HY815_17015, partial [Candidatus Riflebacteria bacterium]|nr:hypothetical protein [Candidatus Riflebacteria bacterium]